MEEEVAIPSPVLRTDTHH